MNIEEKVALIQKEINSIQKVIDQGKELKEISDKFSEVNESIKKIGSNSSEDLSRLVKQELIYKNKMSHLIKDLMKVDQELEQFNRKELEKVLDYLKVYSEFIWLSEEIKNCEKLSLKSTNSKVQTTNAEGRKKEIDEVILDHYNDCVTKKKQINKKYIKAYNALLNYDVSLLKQKEESLASDEDIYLINTDTQNMQVNYVYEEKELKLKLKEINKEIKNLKTLSDNTKKDYILDDGKKYSMSNFSRLCYLKNQKKKIEKELNIENPTVENEPIENKQTPKVVVSNVDQKKRLTMKQKLKKISIAACMGIMSTISIFSLKIAQEKSFVKIENKEELETQEMDENIKEILKENDILTPIDVANIEDNTFQTLRIGDTFTVTKDAKITSDEYKATRKEDEKKPLHDSSMERHVAGVDFLMSDGDIKVARSNDEIDYYKDMGAEVTSYLAANEEGIEGFYNIDYVIPTEKELTGGKRL